MTYSIITINYNDKNGLRKTIESVIHQTFRDFEYIIIDGGSTDGSADILKEYDKHITYWISEPDKGIYNAMNKGIVQSHGKYLIFMNSADCFYNNEVLSVVKQHLNDDIVSGKAIWSNNGEFLGYQGENITMYDLMHTTLPHQATFIKRSLFTNALYDEKYKIASDWKFFIKALILQNCTFHHIDVIICKYDDTGISTISTDLARKEREQILQELLPPRILTNYQYFLKTDSFIRDLIPEFNHTYRFQLLIYNIIKVLIRIRKIFKR